MAWYYGTFDCGCEGRTNVIGPVKNREWIAEKRFSYPCEKCKEIAFQERVEKENLESTEKAEEMELPKLRGSEKQVTWANTLRVSLIEKLEKNYIYTYMNFFDGKSLRCEEKELRDFEIKNLDAVLVSGTDLIEFAITKIEAKWYIDNRSKLLDTLYSEFEKWKKENSVEIKIEKKQLKDVKIESTVIPENAITNSVVEIIFKNDHVKVFFEKDAKFIDIVKNKLGYKWDGVWQKEISELTGTYQERMAEVGNALLNEGFPIMIMDSEIRQNAIDGNFEHECDRWIKASADNKLLAIKWYDKSDLYKTVRKLKGTSYSNSTVWIKIEQWELLQEFAEMYGFKYTKKAIENIEAYKKASEKIEIVNPVKTEKIEKNGLVDILNSSDKVLEDLLDD